MKIIIDDWRSEELQFLSNFSVYPITVCDLLFETNEHLFQWYKTAIPEEQERIRNAATPGQAKRLGQSPKRGGIATLRPNWNALRDGYMLTGLLNKYEQHPDLLRRLIDTHPHELIEGNFWHDNYWGDCRFDISWANPCPRCVNIKGLNKLGEMHMRIRQLHIK